MRGSSQGCISLKCNSHLTHKVKTFCELYKDLPSRGNQCEKVVVRMRRVLDDVCGPNCCSLNAVFDKFEWNSYFSNRRFCFSKELLTQSSVYFSLCFLPIEYITQRHSVSIHYFCWWHSDIATYQLVFHLTLNIHSCLNESLWEVQHWMSNMVLWLISTNSCQ